jgi:hypothetical protein
LTSSSIKAFLVFAAVAIQYSSSIQRDGCPAMTVVVLLSFSSGAQMAMSRLLKTTKITTAMVKPTFMGVAVSPKLGKLNNRLRDRRVIFLIVLTAGCFVGALAQRKVSSIFSILLCAIGNIMVSVGFWFNRPCLERARKD